MTEWDGMEELGWLAYGTLEFFCLAFFFFFFHPPSFSFLSILVWWVDLDVHRWGDIYLYIPFSIGELGIESGGNSGFSGYLFFCLQM